jgi:hypothetical protein
MRSNLTFLESTTKDICTPSGNIFPTALLNRCDTYLGLAYDQKFESHGASPTTNVIPSPDIGGASRQATMKLYTSNNLF